MGAIDVWKCRSCPQTFCEDKRYGVTDLAPEVGLPKIEPSSKWAALICTRNTGSNWTLIQAKPGNMIVHSCTPDTKLELKVGPDYSIEAGPASGIGQHRIILVENFVNAPVDVITGKKHLGTTNANQALGKPFSFTPPLSAAKSRSSRRPCNSRPSRCSIWSLLAQTQTLARYTRTSNGCSRVCCSAMDPISNWPHRQRGNIGRTIGRVRCRWLAIVVTSQESQR